MTLRLLVWWQFLYRSYWFIPSLMSILALLLAIVMVQFDQYLVDHGIQTMAFLPQGDAAGARAILATISGSAITVAGVVFSITIVVLSMASTQYGPGLLPNFMNQRPTQFVLGGFIATFIYCLLVLSYIKQDGDPAVPYYSLLLGLLFGIVSFLFLIYFIHHVTRFIQVPRILTDVVNDLRFALSGMFPERGGGDEGMQQVSLPADFAEQSGRIVSHESNYVQAINYQSLLSISTDHDLVIRVETLPGHYLLKNELLMSVYPRQTLNDELIEQLHFCCLLGDEPTSTQDPLFAVDQIIEIALRALSPGINDPYTALACINKLGEALQFMAEHDEPAYCWCDEQHRPRLFRLRNTYAVVLERSFGQLRQYGADHMVICRQLLSLMVNLARLQLPVRYRDALEQQAALLMEAVALTSMQKHDRQQLDGLYQTFCRLTKRPSSDG